MTKEKKQMMDPKGMPTDSIPRIRYDFFFRIFGMIAGSTDRYFKPSGAKISGSSRLSRMYCRLICTMLWFFTIRGFVLMFVWDKETQVALGDLTGYWNDYRLYYLMPMTIFSLNSAIICTIWRLKEEDLGWLVPFLSIRQHRGEVPADSRMAMPRPSQHKMRILIGILFDMVLVAGVTGSVGFVSYKTAVQNMDDRMFMMWLPWLVVQILWFFYMSGITFFTMTYFDLVTEMVSMRFKTVRLEIEELAERENGPPGSKDKALFSLYYKHNEVCEIVDESNAFWQVYIFFTYMTYIPLACYVLYNVFFADFDELLGPVTWGSFIHIMILVGFVSISAAKVSNEAHAPYTALHTLSLLHLPIDLEVNMSTFLHRVRGPTIGYSCLDLFVITNASISATVAAVASYFLIVADFSRSTVNASQMAKAARAANMSFTLAANGPA